LLYCSSSNIKKNGKISEEQLYKCKDCGKQFRGRKSVDNHQLSHDYIFGKQTLQQLSARYKVSVSTIRRRLQTIRSTRIISVDKNVVVLMDTTYWGRNFGVLVMKDSRTKKILWRKFVKHETLADYKEGTGWLEEKGFKIDGIVCDGLRSMFAQFCRYESTNVSISSS
jgi:uncharacterized C2H2 Zn-finger protein